MTLSAQLYARAPFLLVTAPTATFNALALNIGKTSPSSAAARVSRALRSMERSGMMRCRPGIVGNTTFAKVPDQRRTASLSLALHRIRDTR
jgi:hypothetical protein